MRTHPSLHLETTLPAGPGNQCRVTARLGSDPASARAARTLVAQVLGAWSLQEVTADAVLLTSELVTNAILHAHAGTDGESGDQAISLSLSLGDDRVRIEVTDVDPVPAQLIERGVEATGGRGLRLVDTLARRWGVSASPPGKSVWFELGSEVSPGAVRVPPWQPDAGRLAPAEKKGVIDG